MAGARWAVFLLGLVCATEVRPAAQPVLPSVAQITTNLLQRWEWERTQNFRGQYGYTRVKVSEEFNSKGKLTERNETIHEFVSVAGSLFARTLLRDNKPPTEKERLAQAERERQFRATPPTPAPKAAGTPNTGTTSRRTKDMQFTPELLERYTFKVSGTELVNGRPSWVIEFAPRTKDLPIKKWTDRVSNKIAGKVWVDTQEHEVARLQVRLTEDVSLMGGIVGVLRGLKFRYERTRVDENVWFTTLTDVELSGREVLVNKTIHFREESKNFQKGSAAENPGAVPIPVTNHR